MRRRPISLLLAAGLLLATGCNQIGGDDGQQVTVFAAASLTEPFGELATRFEADHPGVDVVTSFDSSATLAAQVVAGAPADVVATADVATMGILEDDDLLEDPPVTFARNDLALVVPADNPAGIDDVSDLQLADYVMCTEAAPCGALAADVLDKAGVTNDPRSLEVDVKAVLAKVVLGEADAGLVYSSDVVAAQGEVQEVPLPEDATATSEDTIAVTADSDEKDLAEEFLDLVLSPEGQQVLVDAGFSPGPTP
jgi:molybdate transport system substrate-binding protein